MKLTDILSRKKNEIAERWIAAVNGTYPFGTIGFLRTQSNPFHNPVGQRTRQAAEEFTAALISGTYDSPALTAAMDDFMQVRAVQDFTAETAVGIMYAFKQIIRELLSVDINGNSKSTNGDHESTDDPKELLLELLALEANIDALALMAFGAYTRQREKLANLRVEEFKRAHAQIIRLNSYQAVR